MKKLTFKKKILTGILVLALTAAAGGTYAWFTVKVQGTNAQVEMGKMKIAAEYDIDDEDVYYEPGKEIAKEGTLSNLGSIAIFAKVELNPSAKIVSDANGDTLVDNQGNPTSYTITGDENISVVFDESVIGYKEDIDNETFIAWYKDLGNEGTYYLAIDGVATADVIMNVLLDGPGMGNHYMGAKISFTPTWKATQAFNKAIQDELNVNYDDLEFVDKDLNTSAGFSIRSSNSSGERVKQHFDALIKG